MAMNIRIHLYLAKCGIQSRRKSEQIIGDGRVAVNGKTIFRSQLIDTERDRITVDGRVVTPAPHIYYAFHKPVNVICSSARQGECPIVWDFIHVYEKLHLFTVGRLDRLASGLLLITNDSQFCRQVALPRYEIEKEYIVRTYNRIPLDKIYEFTVKGRKETSLYDQALSSGFQNVHHTGHNGGQTSRDQKYYELLRVRHIVSDPRAYRRHYAQYSQGRSVSRVDHTGAAADRRHGAE